MHNTIIPLNNDVEINDPLSAIFFVDNQLVICAKSNTCILPYLKTVDALKLSVVKTISDADININICEQVGVVSHAEYSLCNIRKALLHLDNTNQQRILKHYQWLNWDGQSQYCGSCGNKLSEIKHSPEKRCHHCDKVIFPRFSPAVLVLVSRGDEILLARSAHFPPGDYSVFAGFINMGETAEQAAKREVEEEVGIEIDNLQYFASQSWPFPDSFMIAFTAVYAGGELNIDPVEIEDARWFKKDEIPKMSPSTSIARELIEDYCCRYDNEKKC